MAVTQRVRHVTALPQAVGALARERAGRADAARPRPQVADSSQPAAAPHLGVSPQRAFPADRGGQSGAAARFGGQPIAAHLALISDLLLPASSRTRRLLVVTAPDGEIIWTRGARTMRWRSDRIGMSPGVLRPEAGVGANATGTPARRRGSAVSRFDECFVETRHGWTCVASPVLDPEDGRLLGVIDLCGPHAELGPDTVCLVRTVARLVEREIANDRRAADQRVLVELLSRPGLVSRTAAVFAPDGRLVWGGADDDWAATADREEHLGYTLVIAGERPGSSGLSPIRLRLLGPEPPQVIVDEKTAQLTQRRADLLTLISRAPGGLSADALAEQLYGDLGQPGTVRAEVHRIRRQLAARLASDPYRFTVPVSSDAGHVAALLEQGEVRRAVHAYTGQLLPRSDCLAIEMARSELHESVRRAAMSVGGQTLADYCQSGHGEFDLMAWQQLLAGTTPGSVDHATTTARVDSVHRALS